MSLIHLQVYAAMVYLETGEGIFNLVAAKTRVAPIQTQTVPRLELLGALLLARLVASIRSSLDGLVEESVCFTDSQIALHWIKGVEKHWKPFVLNRVKEIREKVPDYCWHHCQGGSNPADKPSRGLTMKELQECGEWFTGPSWLGESISRENEFSDVSMMPSECLKELRVKDREVVTLSVVEGTGVSIGSIMDIEHFSSYEKLIGSTAYVISFVSKLKQLIGNQEDFRCGDREEDLRRAEVLWLRDAQDNRIRKEWKNQFVLYLDEDKIWRCRGRLVGMRRLC